LFLKAEISNQNQIHLLHPYSGMIWFPLKNDLEANFLFTLGRTKKGRFNIEPPF
jgi:hypothetical protein